jgi:Nuclease-related domain
MKVIDNSAQSEKSHPTNVLGGMIGSIKLGRGLPADVQAQEVVVRAMEKILDNSYVLLRNVSLEGVDAPIPLILVGPPGVQAIYASATRGVYRAKGDEWEQMDERHENYRPALPNLIVQSQKVAEFIRDFLDSHGSHPPFVDPVLVFTDPGVHIEMSHPDVRIVLIDALDRFIATILRSQSYMEKEEIQQIVDLLAKPQEASAPVSPFPDRDAFSFQEPVTTGKRSPSRLDNLPRGERAVQEINKIPFSNRQWFALGCLVIVNILIIIGLVIFILVSR